MKKIHPDQVDRLSLTHEHISALASYAVSEVFACFNPNEPRAIREVAGEIGKTAAAVGDHVKKLVEVGLLIQVGTQKRRSRTEALYANKGLDTHLGQANQPIELREKYVERFDGQMRLLDRQHRALQKVAHEDGQFFDFFQYRWQHVFLTPENAMRLKHLMKDINELAIELNEADPKVRESNPEIVRVNLTQIMLPTQVESKRRKKRNSS
jgi:predicted transcriptional regulator